MTEFNKSIIGISINNDNDKIRLIVDFVCVVPEFNTEEYIYEVLNIEVSQELPEFDLLDFMEYGLTYNDIRKFIIEEIKK